nr:GRAS transcription factor DELLA2 [Dioscorea oppositifolia]
MGPYPCGSAAVGWEGVRSEAQCTAAPDIDGLLAGAGYRVRSSDLCQVAQRLERLESAMVYSSGGGHADYDHLASDAVHYNPSDLASWVDSMLSELTPADPGPVRQAPAPDGWVDQIYPQPQRPVAPRMEEEEDSGIRLVHLLMSSAEAIQRGDAALSGSLIDEMRLLLTRVNTGFGIGKVAGYFVDALTRRLYSVSSAAASGSPAEYEILYHHFYEASPYLKFAHFTANQAILEAFDGHDRVHVIDFSLMHGLQWPALIQALALRPGGPPSLRLTGIGPPSPDGRDSLREIGLRLAELARSVRVRFAFRGVAANRLDDVRPWMLQVAPGEAVAVNSVMQLHRLLTDPDSPGPAPIDSVLSWIHGLRPKIVTVVEQEADHNKPGFLDRFTEALFYYSTMFDSLEAGRANGSAAQQQQSAAVAEVYLQREIRDIVCCEGPDRAERHEPLARWRARMGQTGFKPVHLGSNAFKQASMLLTLFSGEGYCVEEVDGCLTLGWHSRPLIAASAWRADDLEDNARPVPDNFIFSSISSTSNTNDSNNNNHNNINNNIIINGNGSMLRRNSNNNSRSSDSSSQQESIHGM